MHIGKYISLLSLNHFIARRNRFIANSLPFILIRYISLDDITERVLTQTMCLLKIRIFIFHIGLLLLLQTLSSNFIVHIFRLRMKSFARCYHSYVYRSRRKCWWKIYKKHTGRRQPTYLSCMKKEKRERGTSGKTRSLCWQLNNMKTVYLRVEVVLIQVEVVL